MRRVRRLAKITADWKPSDATIPKELDSSTVRLAEAYYDIVQPRPGARTRDRQARIDGWIGQLSFQSLLIKLKIPFIPHVPIYSPLDPEYGVPYDFYVEGVGTIEAKGTARLPYYKMFMVNIREWKRAPCDYGVGVKVRSDTEAVIMGWLPRDEIEKLNVKNDGSGDAYYCNLTEMKPMSSFIEKLKAVKSKLADRS